MVDSNCIFCKIANGEIPSKTVYEDDRFRAILDISPANRGHVIILAKNHAANIFEMSDEDASQVYVVAKKVATAMQKVLKFDGVNIMQNNGEIAGQTVFHHHMHVIPRYKNDKVTFEYEHLSEGDILGDEEVAQIRALAQG